MSDVDDFVHATCPACGGPGRREAEVSDTFFDSSWYLLRHPSADVDDRPWDPARTAPVDLYAGGPEHVARDHLYARFVTMALHDLGLVGFEEPFPCIRLHGTITKDGARMSKSRGNVVSPDDYVDRHGGDALRVHVLSSGRWSGTADFRDAGIAGVERLFSRLWRLFSRLWRLAAGEVDGPGAGGPALAGPPAGWPRPSRACGSTTPWQPCGRLPPGPRPPRSPPWPCCWRPWPRTWPRLWAAAGGAYSVHAQLWPNLPVDVGPTPATVTLVVQVDGRVRARLPVPAGLSAGDARRRAGAAPRWPASLPAGGSNGRFTSLAVW